MPSFVRITLYGQFLRKRQRIDCDLSRHIAAHDGKPLPILLVVRLVNVQYDGPPTIFLALTEEA